MQHVEALVTPSVMGWARKRSGFSLEDAAHKIGRPVDEISKWETGELRPSVAQARKASEVYKRPLAVFYLPEPPEDFETLRDFRTLPDGFSREYSQELGLLIRTTLFRQEWLKDFCIQEQAEPLSFIGSATMKSTPAEVAKKIREVLKITPQDQMRCRSRSEALSLWIDRVEQIGIYVFQQGDVDLQEARGFAIADEYAPFIFINSSDAEAARIFTLAHELCHLWINEPGISNLESFEKTKSDQVFDIEIFCNRVASILVLEPEAFAFALKNIGSNLGLEDKVRALSNIFKVSEEAIARRFLESGTISKARYEELRRVYQERWRLIRDERRKQMVANKKGPSFYVKKLFNNGYAFTQTVISAYRNGAVSGRDASSLLEVKINHLARLSTQAGIPFASGGEAA
jgi:Zn-dependent peptidase ImmA (M78 family)